MGACCSRKINIDVSNIRAERGSTIGMDKYVVNTGKKKPYYSCNEISKHNKESSCWIIIDNKVSLVFMYLICFLYLIYQ